MFTRKDKYTLKVVGGKIGSIREKLYKKSSKPKTKHELNELS